MTMAEPDPILDADTCKDRNFVTALARGLDVLRCFRGNEPTLSNTDIAERTGLPKPTVSRLTHTLCQLDYLVVDKGTGAYRLSGGVLQLGFGVLAGMEIGERAAGVLRDLTAGPNTYITAAIGEPHRDRVVYLAVERSPEDVALMMQVGKSLPMFFSSMGRAVLAAVTQERREELCAIADRLDPENKVKRKEAMATAISEYEAMGYCTSFGVWRPDVNAMAAPVFTLERDRVYGLNIGGPSFHVPESDLTGTYAPRLIAAGEALSIRP